MTFLLYSLGAALLVLTGAVASGGLQLPTHRARRSSNADETADDALSRDLAALMSYGREEDDHAL